MTDNMMNCELCNSKMEDPGYGDARCPNCNALHGWEEGVFVNSDDLEKYLMELKQAVRKIMPQVKDDVRDFFMQDHVIKRIMQEGEKDAT